jgi:hypothetical protein
MRNLAGLVLAAALSACASADPELPVASLQNSVYIAGDQTATVQPIGIPVADAEEDSTLKRLYWFFAGR